MGNIKLKLLYGQLMATLHSLPGRLPWALLLCVRASKRCFQMKEKVKSAEILQKCNAQYKEDILSHTSVCYDLYKKFSEGHKEVSTYYMFTFSQQLYHAKELILGTKWSNAWCCTQQWQSLGSVETIIHELNSLLKKVCACWAPKILMFNHKMQHTALSVFLERRVTCDET